jgi:Fe-S-cluster containining protein
MVKKLPMPDSSPNVENADPAAGDSAPDQQPVAMAMTTLELVVAGERLRLQVQVPAGPTPRAALVPLYRSITEFVVDAGVNAAAAQGEHVSCRKGCGACCRQLVPISEIEARQLRDLVAELPEPRRSQVLARFHEARKRLAQAGLLERLEHPERFADEQLRSLGLEYFRLAIACPFLEEESCSIHPDRPLACREYLVTSPAEHCAHPEENKVRGVPLPLEVSRAVCRMDVPPQARFARWTPLILALAWAEEHPDEPPLRPGPELVGEFWRHLTEPSTPKHE